MHRSTYASRYFIIALLPCFALPSVLAAQGTIRGAVTEAGQRSAADVIVHVSGTTIGARSDSSGLYRVLRVPAGSYVVRVAKIGFSPESATVVVQNGQTVTQNFELHALVQELTAVTVTSNRLGESEAAALQRKADAPNVVDVLAGDVIRALPNVNVAEAARRMPGVTTERDEGEGKFVQVRGTEPELNNVTINGAHVPGTEGGTRVAKLDDIPSDLLAAIEVSKTLTADMDADAIGGSVNLVTKTPEGAPQGYVAGQYGQVDLAQPQPDPGWLRLRWPVRCRPAARPPARWLRGPQQPHDQRPRARVVDRRIRAGGSDRVGAARLQLPPQPVWARWRHRLSLRDGSAIALKGLYSRFEDYGVTYVNDLVTRDGDFGALGDSRARRTDSEPEPKSRAWRTSERRSSSCTAARCAVARTSAASTRADLNAAATDETCPTIASIRSCTTV